jgi:hypothetical protein
MPALMQTRMISKQKTKRLSILLCINFLAGGRTAEFTGPPRGLGFQENPGSAAPAQLLLGGILR